MAVRNIKYTEEINFCNEVLIEKSIIQSFGSNQKKVQYSQLNSALKMNYNQLVTVSRNVSKVQAETIELLQYSVVSTPGYAQ